MLSDAWSKALVLLSVVVLTFSALLFAPVAYGDGNNLINNPSVESASNNNPIAWTPNSWGSNMASLSYASGGHTGSFSLLTTMSGRISGDAKWMPDSVSITGGQSYTYSDYYIANTSTEIDAQYTDSNGNVSYVYLGSVPANSSWTPISETFTAPSNAAKVSVLHILAANGSLQTDDFSLTANVAVTPPPNTDGNLVSNPSFETASGANPSDWFTGGWGNNTTNYSYLTNSGHTGTHSVMVQTTSYTSGDAKWYFKPVAVQAGATYNYADYYKSNIASNLVVQYDDGNGNFTYQGVGDQAASTGWQQAKAAFTVPSNVKYATVFHLINGVGSLQIDDVSLLPVASTPPPPPPPPGGNIVPNSSVETPDPANIHQPQNWHSSSWGANTASFAYLNSGHTGTHSIKTTISSYTSGSAYWLFDSQPIAGGNTYDFSDYYESNVGCGVDATITMKDGSFQYLHLGETFPSTKSWTKFRTQFTAPAGAVSINIVHNIYNVGWLTTDDFSLTPFNYQGFSRPIVSITDDDSYSSYYNNGLPVLQKYGLTATDYIISGYINNDPAYMTSAMVKGLYAAGHEIGSHTVDHPDLTTLGATKMDSELKNSQASLQKLLGVPVADYAAPYGTYNQQVTTDAQKYYQSYRTTQAGYNAKNNLDPYHLMVQNVISTTTTADIQSWLVEAKATNTWLILVYHQVDPALSAGEYNTYPSDFDSQMSAIKASGLPVETVSQALAELEPQL